jgi:hypothetical protein
MRLCVVLNMRRLTDTDGYYVIIIYWFIVLEVTIWMHLF